MQSSAAHIAEAQKFESVLADLEATTHYGWVLVQRFYVVLNRILEKLSREARYECTPFRPKDLADYGPVYLNVRTAMRGALGLPP